MALEGDNKENIEEINILTLGNLQVYADARSRVVLADENVKLFSRH